MTATIVYGDRGRGAWKAKGGTFNSAGTAAGSYYRAPAADSSLPMLGLAAARADKASSEIGIDEYAVWRAAMAIQSRLGTTPDGIWGSDTDAAVKKWQATQDLTADGVFGPKSAKALFKPAVARAAKAVGGTHAADLQTMMFGHIEWESGWDTGAVGTLTPVDLGLGQINGPAHPALSEAYRLDPTSSIPYVADFVLSNLVAMSYNVRDGIAAYNLGQGGARSWIRAGRPDVWVRTSGSVDVKKYIDSVLAAAEK